MIIMMQIAVAAAPAMHAYECSADHDWLNARQGGSQSFHIMYRCMSAATVVL